MGVRVWRFVNRVCEFGGAPKADVAPSQRLALSSHKLAAFVRWIAQNERQPHPIDDRFLKTGSLSILPRKNTRVKGF